MVRGNWQRRVERTEARREARKAEQARRRSKRRSTSIGGDGDRESMYRCLEEWMEDKGRILLHSYGKSGASVTVDVWTDARPVSRQEYLPSVMDELVLEEEEDDGGRKGRSKKDRGGFQNKKGKQHPNAKNKSEKTTSTITANNNNLTPKQRNEETKPSLCSQEFYFGREKCPGVYMKQKRGGGRGRSNSIGEDEVSCQLCHYHQFPKFKHLKSSRVVSNDMPPTPPLTLAQVINGKYMPHPNQSEEGTVTLPVHVREAMIQWAVDATMTSNPDANGDDEQKTQDMMYHSRLYVPSEESMDERNDGRKQGNTIADSDNNNEESQSSEDISEDDLENDAVLQQAFQQLFDNEKLSPLNVIYISIQGILIYDVNRGGMLRSDATERYLLHGQAFDADFGKPIEESSDEFNKHLHEQLTHHILEEILSFLHDEGAAILPQVCKTWRDEVGTRSPQLWKMLLDRRGWLSTVDTTNAEGDDEIISECKLYKDTFISHYLAVRDVQAIANSSNFLQSGFVGGGQRGGGKHKNGIEYAIQSFKATKGSPTFDNSNDIGCCNVKVWPSDKIPRALAAYSSDCTLRLFEAVQGNSSSARMICRQIVSVRASPPSISRKKNKCELVAMDLDDSVVASLVTEYNDWVEPGMEENEIERRITTPWLTVIPCEELICAGNEGILDEECIHSFNVRASILDYILGGASEDIITLRDEVYQYLSVVDSDTSDVLISVTSKIIACGKGNFSFHATISIPGYSLIESPMDHDNEDGESVDSEVERLQRDSTMVVPLSKDILFVISTQKGGSIIHSIPLVDRCNGLFASCPYRKKDEPSVLCTNIVIQGRQSLQFERLMIQRNGTIDCKRIDDFLSGDVRDDVCIEVTPTHVYRGTLDGIQVWEIDKQQEQDHQQKPFLRLPNLPRLSLDNLTMIHKDYLVAIILQHDETFDGHWFGPANHPITATTQSVLVYHTTSSFLLHECTTTTAHDLSPPNLHHLSIDVRNDIVAISVSTLGFVLAGARSRDVVWKAGGGALAAVVASSCDVDHSSDVTTPSKGKKKRLAAKTTKKEKKDGFARGMSMRG